MTLIPEMVLFFWFVFFLSLKANGDHLSKQKAAVDMIINNEKTGILFVAHHKTGSSLAKALMRLLRTNIDKETTELVHVWNWYWEWHLQSYTSLGNKKIVHFVRDPMSQIVSAYNYHMLGSESWEFSWKLRTPYERKVLNCSEQSPVFVDCLRSKNMHDGLITQVLMNMYYPTRKNFVNFLPAMVLEYQSFELLPELAMNVCLEEFESDFEGTLTKICNFIGICGDIKVLNRLLDEKCSKGRCNIASKTQKKWECHQTSHWGASCPYLNGYKPLFEHTNYDKCVRECKRLKHTCRTIVENNEDKCRIYAQPCEDHQRSAVKPTLYSVTSQTCYDLSDFQVAAVEDLYTSLERKPLLKKRIEELSKQMRCRAVDIAKSVQSSRT